MTATALRRPRIRTWRTKLLLLLLAFAAVPLVVQALWDYLATRGAFEASMLASTQGLAHAKAQAIDQLTLDRRALVERIAGLLPGRARAALAAAAAAGNEPLATALPPLRDAETLPTSGPATPVPADLGAAPGPAAAVPQLQLREALSLLLLEQRQFEELLVIDLQGRVLASTHEEHEGHSADALDYFRHGRASTYMQPLFLSPLTHQLTMVIATPIRDPARAPLAVLAARLNLRSFFAIVTETAGLGETGETVVARREDGRVVFMAPTRFDPQAALQRAVAIGARSGTAEQASIQPASGAGRRLDYRGKEVLAAWEHVPSLDWGVVVKIDREEALRPAVHAGLRALALMLPLIAGVLAVSWLASKALVRPLWDLREAADRISRGDFDVQLDLRSDDEIGELADSFDRMVAAIKFFREHSRREEDEEFDEELV